MEGNFAEIKLFQVRPDRLQEFEALIESAAEAQRQQTGCVSIRCVKRMFTIDGVEAGDPPRELTKIVKCVRYLSYWEFDSRGNYGRAVAWFFENHGRDIQKLLIMPFDINCGYNIC